MGVLGRPRPDPDEPEPKGSALFPSTLREVSGVSSNNPGDGHNCKRKTPRSRSRRVLGKSAEPLTFWFRLGRVRAGCERATPPFQPLAFQRFPSHGRGTATTRRRYRAARVSYSYKPSSALTLNANSSTSDTVRGWISLATNSSRASSDAWSSTTTVSPPGLSAASRQRS